MNNPENAPLETYTLPPAAKARAQKMHAEIIAMQNQFQAFIDGAFLALGVNPDDDISVDTVTMTAAVTRKAEAK